MSNEVVFPSKENSAFRSKLIDALLDVRLTLSIKKITSDFIKKNDFKRILDELKEKLDLKVKNAIDDVFSEYFDKGSKKDFSNTPLSLDEMGRFNDSSDSINKGTSLVKTSPYYKSNPNDVVSSDKAA